MFKYSHAVSYTLELILVLHMYSILAEDFIIYPNVYIWHLVDI